jgi:hypothetical protein
MSSFCDCKRCIATCFYSNVKTQKCCPLCPNGHTPNCEKNHLKYLNDPLKITTTDDFYDFDAGKKSVGLRNNTELCSLFSMITSEILRCYVGANEPRKIGSCDYHFELIKEGQTLTHKVVAYGAILDKTFYLRDLSKWNMMGKAFVFDLGTFDKKRLHFTIAYDPQGRFIHDDLLKIVKRVLQL